MALMPEKSVEECETAALPGKLPKSFPFRGFYAWFSLTLSLSPPSSLRSDAIAPEPKAKAERRGDQHFLLLQKHALDFRKQPGGSPFPKGEGRGEGKRPFHRPILSGNFFWQRFQEF